MHTRVCTPAFFDIATPKVTVFFRVHFYPGEHPGVVSRVRRTPYFDKNIVFFRVHILHEAAKSVHTGVYTGIFRHFDPKIHCFLPCSFFYPGVHPGVVSRGCRTPYFGKSAVFFRIHILHEAVKKVCTGVHTGIFRHFDPENHVFAPCSFLHRCALGVMSRVCTTPHFNKNIIFFRVN